MFYTRVVPIPRPVLENAADTTENAGIGIGEYTSLCTNQTPYHVTYKWRRDPTTSQKPQLALTDITHLTSFFFATLKQHSGSWAALPLATTIFKSDEEELKEPTELAKYLHSKIFYTGKSKEMCKEVFFKALILDWYSVMANPQV